jgi:nitroreductase
MLVAPQPGSLPSRQLLENVVAAAVMAPSSHNTQPWRFRLQRDGIEVLADPARHLAVIDGDRRQLIQSCGCALFNARVAIRAMGYAEEVAVLPDPRRPELLAAVRVGEARPPSEVYLALMRALPVRRTNRRPFLDRPVGRSDGERLLAAAAYEGAWALRLTPSEKARVAAIVDRADQLQYSDPAFRAELAAWLTTPGSFRRDGIPFIEKEYGSALPFSVLRALRSPSLPERFAHLEEELVQRAPFVVVIGASDDGPAGWLAAGQALQAMLLYATGLGLVAGFLNQALEVAALRAEVAALVEARGIAAPAPTMVLRLGYAAEPIHQAAPRRPLGDVIVD